MPAVAVDRSAARGAGSRLPRSIWLRWAIVVAAWPSGSRQPQGEDAVGRWLLGAAAGFGLAFVAIMAAIVIDGSSLADVYEGVITEALRVREIRQTRLI